MRSQHCIAPQRWKQFLILPRTLSWIHITDGYSHSTKLYQPSHDSPKIHSVPVLLHTMWIICFIFGILLNKRILDFYKIIVASLSSQEEFRVIKYLIGLTSFFFELPCFLNCWVAQIIQFTEIKNDGKFW